MGFFVFIILIIGIVAIVSASNSGKGSSGGYHGGYIRNFDEDYETRAAMGERDYFTDDSARDYNSYYAQVADDAMMDDESAMEEMRGEFGEGDW